MPTARLAGLFVLVAASTHAQWLHYPAPGTPRTHDGKPNLAAKAPRASNGKPDLSGVWQAEYAAPGENERLFGAGLNNFVVPGDDPRTFSKYFLNILADFKPEDPPRGELDNYLPFKIIQTPEVVAVLYEESNTYRQIYTHGRKLPDAPQPAWMGLLGGPLGGRYVGRGCDRIQRSRLAGCDGTPAKSISESNNKPGTGLSL